MITNKAQPNIIWVVTDSARNFSTGGLDDRDRPEFYDTLLEDFVNFQNCVTSAPSSVMSASCMLTGMNSYYIGRNYDDFRYEEGAFPNLASILKHSGYETKGLFVAREMREKIAPFIGDIERNHWPARVKHADRMWTNESANEIVENFLANREVSDPLFLMVWNNIRHDAKISNNLDELLQKIKKHGYYDNSLIIFCSDHGYPHPRRGFTPEYLKREGLTHDLMLGDDNILIPLLIKAPDCVPETVNTQVGTIDLFPTVLDYVGIDDGGIGNEFPQSGKSLRTLLNNSSEISNFEQRAIRCDCRFFGQTQRKTALRKGRYKYIFSHDDSQEEFYDVIAEPLEDESIPENPANQQIISELREMFRSEERIANQFQKNYLAKNLARMIQQEQSGCELIILSLLEKQMNDCIIETIGQKTSVRVAHFIGRTSRENQEFDGFKDNLDSIIKPKILDIKGAISDGAKAIILGVKDEKLPPEISSLLKKEGILVDKILDINIQSSEGIKWNRERLWKALASRKDLILKEPTVILVYLKSFFKILKKRIFSR